MCTETAFLRKEIMQIQKRDLADPFTQALRILLKEKGLEFKEKTQSEMTALIKQIAIKIGAHDTVKVIRDRALPFFTGTISIYLASLTDKIGTGENQVARWVDEINVVDMKTLFRKGYTILDNFGRHTSRKVNFLMEVRTESRLEAMEAYATHRDEGIWDGYVHYASFKTVFDQSLLLEEFSQWLVKNAKDGAKAARAKEEDSEDIIDSNVIVFRMILNLLHTGKISFSMTYQRIRDIVEQARGNKKWERNAEARYKKFVSLLPQPFKKALETEEVTEVTKAVAYALSQAHGMTHLTKSIEEDIDIACLNSGIMSPGESLRIRREIKEMERPL